MNGHSGPSEHGTSNEGHAMAGMMKAMPRGIPSPSGHYWCSMCKKMFVLDEPVCPYMPKMCVNTPVAIETLPPGSTAFYEKVGLFYPKLVQRVLAAAVGKTDGPEALGAAFAQDFLDDLAEWDVRHESSPIEAVKAFLIYTAGFDVAVRSTDTGITFLLMDAEALWGEELNAKKRSRSALLAGARRVAQAVGWSIALDLHFMTVMPGKMGRYFCAGCQMFFEFGKPAEEVTCPFMPQKCIFRPKPIAKTADVPPVSDLRALTKIFAVSPKLYRRQLESAVASGLDRVSARELLSEEMKGWGFDLSDPAALASLWQQMGIE